ncbi:hypothetical protein LSAT2_006836 [Lamellibrachia satsuma]|nr:hypothetical protein LSAT2_006836 [Lamellibrachia satsuma]
MCYETCIEKVLKEKMKGNSEFQQEKYRSALSSYTNGLYRSLYNYILYGNRAQAYIKLGKFWEAMCDGYRCVILKPDWPKGQYRYAEAWYKLGDLEKAISVVQTAVELNPNDRDLNSQKDRFIAERQKRKRPSKSSSMASKCHEIKTDSGPRVVDKETQSNTPDSDSDDLPDLTSSDEDDTDDTDSDTTNNLPVSQTRRTKTQEKTKTDRLYTIPRNIERLLQHGSEALLQHQPAKALQEYTQAQTVIGKLKHVGCLHKWY